MALEDMKTLAKISEKFTTFERMLTIVHQTGEKITIVRSRSASQNRGLKTIAFLVKTPVARQV